MRHAERAATEERIGWILDHFHGFLFALCCYPGADAVEQAKTSHRCAECV